MRIVMIALACALAAATQAQAQTEATATATVEVTIDVEDLMAASELPATVQEAVKVGTTEEEVGKAVAAMKKNKVKGKHAKEVAMHFKKQADDGLSDKGMSEVVHACLEQGMRGQELVACMKTDWDKKPHVKKGEEGKPAEAGMPEDKGKPAEAGKPEDKGKPAEAGKPEDKGKPAEAGKGEGKGKTIDAGKVEVDVKGKGKVEVDVKGKGKGK